MIYNYDSSLAPDFKTLEISIQPSIKFYTYYKLLHNVLLLQNSILYMHLYFSSFHVIETSLMTLS